MFVTRITLYMQTKGAEMFLLVGEVDYVGMTNEMVPAADQCRDPVTLFYLTGFQKHCRVQRSSWILWVFVMEQSMLKHISKNISMSTFFFPGEPFAYFHIF